MLTLMSLNILCDCLPKVTPNAGTLILRLSSVVAPNNLFTSSIETAFGLPKESAISKPLLPYNMPSAFDSSSILDASCWYITTYVSPIFDDAVFPIAYDGFGENILCSVSAS